MDKDFARGERMMRRPDLQQGQQRETDQLQNASGQRNRFQPSWAKQGVIWDTDDDVLPPIPAHLKTNAWTKKNAQLDQTPIVLSNASAPQPQQSGLPPIPAHLKTNAWTKKNVQLDQTPIVFNAAAPQPQQLAQGSQPQLVAQVPAQPEGQWMNSGVAAKGGLEIIPFDGRIVRVDKEGKQVTIPVKYGQPFRMQPGDQLQSFFDLTKFKPQQKANSQGQSTSVTTFKKKLSDNAQKRLQSNYNRLNADLKAYKNLSPENPKWQQLRQLSQKDQQLVQLSKRLDGQIGNLVIKDRKESSFTSPNTFIDRDDVYPMGVIDPKIQAQIRQIESQQQLIKIARRQMQAQYPALAVIDSATVANSSNAQVLGTISQGFGQIQSNIKDLSQQIQKDPSKALLLDDVVKGTLQGLKIDPNNPKQSATNKAIIDYLKWEKTKDNIFKWGGTLLTGGLTVGAIIATFATEGAALPFFLGLGGAATGLGTAAYEYRELATVDLAANAQQGGTKLTSQDKDTARFNLIMGRVNLLMAGLDVGLSVKAMTGMLKGARSAGQMSTLAKAIKDKDRVVLELFGGKEGKVPGAINVDIVAEKGIRADLMKDKLSFIPNNSVDEIVTFNPYIPKEAGGTGIMDYLPEAARVLKPGGRIIVSGTNNNKFAQLKGSVDLQKMNLRIVEQKIPLPDNFKDLTFYRIDGSELPTDKMVTTILEKIK
jgi:SAM-dependent methyltransferase